MSAAELARRSGLSPQQISKIETDKAVTPRLATVERLAHALGYTTVEELLSGLLPPGTMRGSAPSYRRDVAQPIAAAGAVSIDEYRRLTSGVRPLPVYRWGFAGDPRDRQASPNPDHEEYPPVGKESLVGPNGFGVIVRGDSMARRNILEGDVAWINPDRPPRIGGIVLARIRNENSEDNGGMVIKTYAAEGLSSNAANLGGERFDVIGPVVCMTRTLLPD